MYHLHAWNLCVIIKKILPNWQDYLITSGLASCCLEKKMAAKQRNVLPLGLQAGAEVRPGVKVEKLDSVTLEVGTGKGLHARHAGNIGGFWERNAPDHVKRENAKPWEAQLQEFLRAMETSQSDRRNPHQLGPTVREARTVPSHFAETSDSRQCTRGLVLTQQLLGLSREAQHGDNSQEECGKVKEEILEDDTVSRPFKDGVAGVPEVEGAPSNPWQCPLFREIKQEGDRDSLVGHGQEWNQPENLRKLEPRWMFSGRAGHSVPWPDRGDVSANRDERHPEKKRGKFINSQGSL
ncbi:UNVERIFIED_CONTAM: hypothetical protein K2H54_062094 [Gekko kuhli]